MMTMVVIMMMTMMMMAVVVGMMTMMMTMITIMITTMTAVRIVTTPHLPTALMQPLFRLAPTSHDTQSALFLSTKGLRNQTVKAEQKTSRRPELSKRHFVGIP